MSAWYGNSYDSYRTSANHDHRIGLRGRRPIYSEILTAATDAIEIFEARGTRVCAVGGLACKLEGNIRTPNDVDLLILDTTSSQEQLKQILVNANPKFYLIAARDPSATYKVLWYRTTLGIRVKVDLLQPGIMSIPDFPSRLIQNKQYLTYRIPTAPFELVLLLKLQAWEQHQQSLESRYYMKHHTDAEDINHLLPLAIAAGVTCDYLPSEFRREARRRVRAYVQSHPSSKEHWDKIKLRRPIETSTRGQEAPLSRVRPSREPLQTTAPPNLETGLHSLANDLSRLRIHQHRLRALDSIRTEAIQRRTRPRDKHEAAEAAANVFEQAKTESCIFGSLSFKLLGVTCKPNDVDIIVLDTTKSLEDVKEYLVKACDRFYLVPSRNRKAEYHVLWYATHRGARRVKVDILQPGEMSIPTFSASLISYKTPPGLSGSTFNIPIASLELVLLLKLGGWLVHYTSQMPHFRAKEPEDVKQIRGLLIQYKRQLDSNYLPDDFLDMAEENVQTYASEYPSSQGSWRRVRLHH